MVERDRPQVTIWRMRIACSALKTTKTHSEYIILIALPLQQWLHERASMLSLLSYPGFQLIHFHKNLHEIKWTFSCTLAPI